MAKITTPAPKCPTCKAVGDEPCLTGSGKVTKTHASRAAKSLHETVRAIDVAATELMEPARRSVVDRLRDANPFARAARDAFAGVGQPALEELSPMIEFKATYADRLEQIDKRRRDKLIESGRPVSRPATRGERRVEARRAAKGVLRGKRVYRRGVEQQQARERTALAMSRVAAGDVECTPAMRRNVLRVIGIDEAAKVSA